MEPPETPAPLFALRAFQSALFGTPKADDEDNRNSKPKTNQTTHSDQKSHELNTRKHAEQKENPSIPIPNLEPDLATTVMASPTKSILMTPGTASNRRKTVSFGEGVVDNERKRDDASNRSVKTPVMVSGNISSQWASSSSESKRSRLTQTLMDSRDKSSRASEKASQKPSEPHSSEADSKLTNTPAQGDENEDTINLNEPRSRSGKYWKAEFDSYRTKTALEIKRLIQYRSAAKQYAKMKDEEAYRLAAKLKEEELKVEEMERHVTQLASTMVAENTRADKEQLVQDLTKQTALALQYKHKVSLLRKALEQHGVVGNEVDEISGPQDANISSKEATEALYRTQQALAQANAKIDEMKQQQSDFEKLKGLALSSEQKASELEKENNMLKHTLARVKQETSKYEDRRKEREAKLKQRETKLETRIREYRDRLKATSQHHREQEEGLKASFDEERRSFRDQNEALRTRVRALEYSARQRQSDDPRHQNGVFAHDSGHISPQKQPFDETGETDQPSSPSPRGPRLGIIGDLPDQELRRAMKEMGIKDIDEKLNNINISPLKSFRPPRYLDVTDLTIPSSPPENLSIEIDALPRGGDNRRAHATASLPSRRLHIDGGVLDVRHNRLYRARPSATKYNLAALASHPETQRHDRFTKRLSLAAAQRVPAPLVERKPAAHKRHERKEEPRLEGRERKEGMNVRTAVKT
ncbi:spindle pole body formation-associated protein-domain-containing protein [Aspergillus pseudoustus]|uniref:Spindle pole body formation-associated protein-domain-containing protein n=1 Tax=Aspergillus pseudoustus TaxID=1810923 RepID=A0ABR4KKY2_9EURO